VSATPLGQYFAAHQHAVSVEVTNVIGPPGPVYLFGARVLAILPIVGPVGNMGPVLCAFSYAGQLFLVVTADAHGFPDLDVLMAGMETEGRARLAAVAGWARWLPVRRLRCEPGMWPACSGLAAGTGQPRHPVCTACVA